MRSPKISIVIPSLNKARFIKKTLDSIFSQKYKNIEVIVQDGGSTDKTLDIINIYIKKYKDKIFLESKKDNGQLDAINVGLQKATGEIVTYINADDVYEQGAFQAVANYYIKNINALWFVGRATVINESGVEIAKLITVYKNFLLSLNNVHCTLITNYFMQPSVFLTRNAYEKYGPFTGTVDFVMEYGLWLKLSKVQMPEVININLSKFRIEPTTKTKRLFKGMLMEDRKIVENYTNNKLMLLAHDFHNWARVIVSKFV